MNVLPSTLAPVSTFNGIPYSFIHNVPKQCSFRAIYSGKAFEKIGGSIILRYYKIIILYKLSPGRLWTFSPGEGPEQNAVPISLFLRQFLLRVFDKI